MALRNLFVYISGFREYHIKNVSREHSKETLIVLLSIILIPHSLDF